MPRDLEGSFTALPTAVRCSQLLLLPTSCRRSVNIRNIILNADSVARPCLFFLHWHTPVSIISAGLSHALLTSLFLLLELMAVALRPQERCGRQVCFSFPLTACSGLIPNTENLHHVFSLFDGHTATDDPVFPNQSSFLRVYLDVVIWLVLEEAWIRDMLI